MMKKLLPLLFVVCSFILFGCDAEYDISPKFEGNYAAPAYNAIDPTVKLYVNDYSKRVMYVGEEFEVKIALYQMPQFLVATSLDLSLGSGISVKRIEYDNSEAGYFAKKESTLTVVLKYPDISQTKIAFVKTYLNGTTPNVSARGVLFKVICKATAKTSGFVSIAPMNITFWQMTSAGVVGTSGSQVQFTPAIEPVLLQIRDDLFVP